MPDTLLDARVLALPPDLVASRLAARAYDLRHSALSTWLNAGVDPAEVAERARSTVETLLRTYAKCLYGRQAVANDRIDKLLGEYGAMRGADAWSVRDRKARGRSAVAVRGVW